ncbi:LysR family nitrogen assimilation transcriptional regulator [Natronocella acetinitrilica]|uniref:LysR family nitrogen assimilation transcriptional regulator n=1 Tax=Natronocella acetinitrilica TaxID=414046 RepID=A0AAE3G7J9_9GAMM|nr:LysR family transcriptional regulator [Natronocella acetinitrilica]MCP1677236.1 LysR family nitrogen assimilation transcriptional regulator [Natronocella acetinitrilica]
MDIRQIRTFVYVAELQSFTRASAFLHISQPALSRQIRILENEVGIKLFHRSGHGVEITEQGRVLLDRCVSFLNQFESLRTGFEPKAHSLYCSGEVTVGLPVPATRFIGQDFLARFKKKHLGISLKIAEGFNPLIHEWLLSGSIDLAILYGSFSSSILGRELLAVEDLFAIGAATPENLARSTISAAELVKETLILPHRPHILRTIVDELGSDASIIEVNAITLMFEMARSGQGYAILPGNALNPAIATGDVVALKIKNPTLNWEVGIWHSNLQELSEPVQLVRDMIREEVVHMVEKRRWSACLAADLKLTKRSNSL